MSIEHILNDFDRTGVDYGLLFKNNNKSTQDFSLQVCKLEKVCQIEGAIFLNQKHTHKV